MRPCSTSALAALLLLAPAAALAIDLADGKLSLHGDGEWAYRRSSHGNSFQEATPDGNYDTALFDLVLAIRPTTDLVIQAQLGFDPGETSAEWVFAEWRLSDRVRARVGKVQQPVGNFNELRFAGTTRAFLDLPVSVYGPANVLGTAYLGVGLAGDLGDPDGWNLAWDLYGGAVKMTRLEPYLRLEEAALPDAPVAEVSQQAREVVGGRLSLNTPREITVRLSGYGGQLRRDELSTGGFAVYGLSLLYRGERLFLAAEGFHSIDFGSEQGFSGYATAAWFFTEHLQGALRCEGVRTRLHGNVGAGSPLLRHQEAAVSLNWWVNAGLALKASLHAITGNRFALPEEATTAGLVDAPPSRHTTVVVVGSQFTF